jgi:hypothetical protein
MSGSLGAPELFVIVVVALFVSARVRIRIRQITRRSDKKFEEGDPRRRQYSQRECTRAVRSSQLLSVPDSR